MSTIKHGRSLGLTGTCCAAGGIRIGATFRGWTTHRRIWQVARPSRRRLLMLSNGVTVFGRQVDMDESKSG